MTGCRKGHQNFNISVMLPAGRNSKICRRVRGLTHWLDQQVPHHVSEMFVHHPNFHRGVGDLRSVFNHTDEATLHIHIFLRYVLNLFFQNYIFLEYSHLEKQCESTCQIWKDKWIRFSINPLLSFFIKWKGWSFPRCTEFLGASIFFCVLDLFSTSLFPSHKWFQWNSFTEAEYVTLWRRKPLFEG